MILYILLGKDMDFKNEKNVLINLYYKHGLSYELKYGL